MFQSIRDRIYTLRSDGCYHVFFALAFLTGGITGNIMFGVAAVFHTGYIIYIWRDKGALLLPDRKETGLWVICLLGAAGTLFWGIDRGESFIGLLRVCSIFLFRLTYLQLTDGSKRRVLSSLPDIGAVMTLLAGLLSLLPVCKDLFIEGGRFAGTFQYANTYGLFMLLGIVVLHHAGKDIRTFVCYLILALGLYMSGSRTVWILYICMEMWFLLSGRRVELRVVICAVMFPIAIMVTSVLMGTNGPAGRFLTIGAMESTFVGRLLYASDALPMLVKYPLGMGYMGYFYLQQAMQTGVYRVRFVHNDILQIALDYGIPILMVSLGCIVRALLNKDKPRLEKELLAVILLGSMFDFHLQYQSIMWLLIILVIDGGGRKAHISISSKRGILTVIACSATSFVFLLNSVGQAACITGKYDIACQIAPWNSDAQLYRMLSQDTLDDAAACAEKILRNNPFQKEAHKILAYYYMMEQGYLKMADEYEIVLSLDRYNESAYDEYGRMLINAEKQCIEERWDSERIVMIGKLSKINDMKKEVIRNTSYLAYLIDDKPKLDILQ